MTRGGSRSLLFSLIPPHFPSYVCGWYAIHALTDVDHFTLSYITCVVLGVAYVKQITANDKSFALDDLPLGDYVFQYAVRCEGLPETISDSNSVYIRRIKFLTNGIITIVLDLESTGIYWRHRETATWKTV